MRRLLGVGVALAMAAMLTTSPAKAVTLTEGFNFTGSAFNVSGTISFDSAINGIGGHDVLGITGSVIGPTAGSTGSITGLIVNPNQPNPALYTDPITTHAWNYDNVVFSGTPVVDNNGFLFNFGTGDVGNFYSVGTSYFFSVAAPDQYYNPGDAGSLSTTPLPAALPLFGSALGAGGLVGWFRKRKKQVLANAPA